MYQNLMKSHVEWDGHFDMLTLLTISFSSCDNDHVLTYCES